MAFLGQSSQHFSRLDWRAREDETGHRYVLLFRSNPRSRATYELL